LIVDVTVKSMNRRPRNLLPNGAHL
jgi:hypothetical protein